LARGKAYSGTVQWRRSAECLAGDYRSRQANLINTDFFLSNMVGHGYGEQK